MMSLIFIIRRRQDIQWNCSDKEFVARDYIQQRTVTNYMIVKFYS